MVDFLIFIVSMAVVCSALLGTAAYVWVEILERKLKKRIAKSEEKITALGDWQMMHSKKLTMLESDFDRLVQEKFPELWPEFSLKDPEDRKRYREHEVDRKIRVAIQMNAEDAGKRLAEMANGLVSIDEIIYPDRRIKPELKSEDFYFGLVEPKSVRLYSNLRMKRGSNAWLEFVLDDLREKHSRATDSRKAYLKEGMDFCEMVLKNESTINELAANSSAQDSFIGKFTSQLGGAPKAIDYAHEIEVAMRFLSTRLTDTKIPKKWDSSFHLGAIGWAEVEPVLKQAQEGKLVEWIEKEYNPQCKPYVQINTRKEADRV